MFLHQIRLAKAYRLPVIIHTRSSTEDAIKIIKDNYDQNLSGQFHCFSGDK
ncbi:MAG: TatD family hydrolase [Ignavibacteria bacterium]|nr:TatD family hydrolase [Ignavibacteria bacterium]